MRTNSIGAFPSLWAFTLMAAAFSVPTASAMEENKNEGIESGAPAAGSPAGGASKEALENTEGDVLSVGSTTAKEDGTGTIVVELDKENSNETSKLKLDKHLKLTEGVTPGQLNITPLGQAEIDFTGAKPGMKVEAFLPEMVVPELVLQSEEQEREKKPGEEKADHGADKTVGMKAPQD